MVRKTAFFFGVLFLSSVVVGLSLPLQAGSAQDEKETLTGCLNKGEEAGTFVLTEPETGEKITVKGSADLAAHASNHTVKLTGTMTEQDDGSKVFEVSKVEHVAATCKAPTE